MSSRVPAAPTNAQKTRLFCQRCDHASPLDGDWLVYGRDDGTTVLRCPDCHHVVDERPAFDGDHLRYPPST